MRRMLVVGLAAGLVIGASVAAADNELGLYFSDSEFTQESAVVDNAPGFAMIGYIVLTGATGASVAGYEVSITASAPDFSIFLISVFGFENDGTDANQIVQFASPVPVEPGGTVLCSILFTTDSTEYEEISFGPSDPSSLPDDMPVVDFGGNDILACAYPFGTPVVAWLNADPVPVDARSWSRVKALFD